MACVQSRIVCFPPSFVRQSVRSLCSGWLCVGQQRLVARAEGFSCEFNANEFTSIVFGVRLPCKNQHNTASHDYDDDESLATAPTGNPNCAKKHEKLEQQKEASNMIVNSYPYNPSQQQQQRCVGLNQTASASESATTASSKPTTTNQSQEASMNNRLLNLSSISQQNSLYGSSFDHTAATTTVGQQQQQQQGAQFLHDLHFDSPMNPIDAQIMGGQDLSSSRMKAPQRSAANHISQSSHQSQDNSQATTATSAVSATANNDMSLYSPSSSTSLLYHIYDQINDQQYDANNNNGIGKHTTLNNQNKTNKNNNATILNPANLFGSQQQQQLPLQVQMQMHHQHQHQHQHQLSQLAEMQKQQQQQQCYSTYQQHPFSTLNPHHTSNSHHQTASYMTLAQQQQQLQLQQNNLMLDTVMRHQRLQRPLSSSAASSMSGQSIPAYGRHPRQSFMTNLGTNGAGFATTTAASSKSQNNLANVLHANQTTLGHLNHPHLIFGSNNSPLTPPIGGKKHPSKMGPTSCFDCNHFSKQLNQRARHLFYEYRTIVKCSLLLIVLAFALLTVIKFTLLSASVSTPTSSSTQASQQQIITPPFLISSSTSTSANLNNPSSNIFYPPPYQHSNQKRKSLLLSVQSIDRPTDRLLRNSSRREKVCCFVCVRECVYCCAALSAL